MKDTRFTGIIWHKNANRGRMTWQEAIDYCASLGDGWRLPTVHELSSLVDYSEKDQAKNLIGQGFTGVQSDYYWSSSSYAGYPSYAWGVYLSGGYVGYDGKSNSLYVWPVRSGQ